MSYDITSIPPELLVPGSLLICRTHDRHPHTMVHHIADALEDLPLNGAKVLVIPGDVSLEAVPDHVMAAAGWVRAKGEEILP